MKNKVKSLVQKQIESTEHCIRVLDDIKKQHTKKAKSSIKRKEVNKKPDIISFDIKMNINYKESSSITLYFYSDNYGNAYLANLKTPVEMRKKGNATKLIDAAEKLAKSMGAQFILCYLSDSQVWLRKDL
jgi:hypothetical protein